MYFYKIVVQNGMYIFWENNCIDGALKAKNGFLKGVGEIDLNFSLKRQLSSASHHVSRSSVHRGSDQRV